MKFEYQYFSQDERQSIIDNQPDLVLVEDRNVAEGNFLVFSDSPLPVKTMYINVPEEEFENLKLSQSATDATLLELMESTLLGGM